MDADRFKDWRDDPARGEGGVINVIDDFAAQRETVKRAQENNTHDDNDFTGVVLKPSGAAVWRSKALDMRTGVLQLHHKRRGFAAHNGMLSASGRSEYRHDKYPARTARRVVSAPCFARRRRRQSTAKIAARATGICRAIADASSDVRASVSVRAPSRKAMLQPKPTISGTKDLPGIPAPAHQRSILKPRAPYVNPESLRAKERTGTSSLICGTSGRR